MTSTPTTCSRCGMAASGNFCAACGAPLGSPACSACGTTLSPNASFCHKCGAPAGAAGRIARGGVPAGLVPFPARDRTPWLIATLLVAVVVVGVVAAATRRAAPVVPTMANAGNAVQGVADDPSTAAAGRAPDISNLTPKEQYNRLVARISQAMDKGDTSTVITFTPMALGAYANLPPADRDIDARFHAAILQAEVGMFDNARALADTIMQLAPDNLFGYYIRATVAEFSGDSTTAKAARAGFRTHFDAEMKKQRPEYAEHQALLQQYRQGEGAH